MDPAHTSSPSNPAVPRHISTLLGTSLLLVAATLFALPLALLSVQPTSLGPGVLGSTALLAEDGGTTTTTITPTHIEVSETETPTPSIKTTETMTPTPTEVTTGDSHESPTTSSHETSNTSEDHLVVTPTNSTEPIDLEEKGTEVTLESSSDSLDIEKADGTSASIPTDSLTKINQELESKHISLHKDGNATSLTQQGTEATSSLPISVDLHTQTFSVTTGDTAKSLTLLPNDAIQILLQNGILSIVTTDSTTKKEQITLTQSSNEPVFVVTGLEDKHLFGIFPIEIGKTVTISAQTGDVKQVQEDTLTKIIDFLTA